MHIESHRASITHTTIIMVTIDDMDLEDAPRHVIDEALSARTVGDHLRALGSLADSCESRVPFDEPTPFLGVWDRAMSEVRDRIEERIARSLRESIIAYHRVPPSRVGGRALVDADVVDETPALPPPQKLIGDGKP